MKLPPVLGPLRLPFVVLTPCCVAVGVATAYRSAGALDPAWAIWVLLGAIASHVSVNAFNEYFDFRSGLDGTTQRTPFSGGSGTLPAHPELAMTTLVIGNSVARAFGLVGALSIVRFRTVVEDTRDTAFVIFAVVVGMAIGSGYLTVTLLGVPLVSLTALGLGRIAGPAAPSPDQRELVVRVGIGVDPERLFAPAFERALMSHRLQSVLSARQGAALDLHYSVQLRPGESPLALVKSLHPLEGVQSVELREAD